jgi:hypothetical protein
MQSSSLVVERNALIERGSELTLLTYLIPNEQTYHYDNAEKNHVAQRGVSRQDQRPDKACNQFFKRAQKQYLHQAL